MEFGGSKMHDKYIHYPVILVHIQIHCIRFVIPDQPITGVLFMYCEFWIMCHVQDYVLRCVLYYVFWIMCSGLCVLDCVLCYSSRQHEYYKKVRDQVAITITNRKVRNQVAITITIGT